jgi:hypothetical protein
MKKVIGIAVVLLIVFLSILFFGRHSDTGVSSSEYAPLKNPTLKHIASILTLKISPDSDSDILVTPEGDKILVKLNDSFIKLAPDARIILHFPENNQRLMTIEEFNSFVNDLHGLSHTLVPHSDDNAVSTEEHQTEAATPAAPDEATPSEVESSAISNGDQPPEEVPSE